MRPPSNSPNLARRLQFCGVVLLLLLLALYYNWAMTEKAGQYIGYKTLTTKIKLEIYLNKQPDTSWHGQSQFILDHMKTHPLPQSVAKHVVDLGAHDGVWLSNSFPFVQRGFGALLVEGNPLNYNNLQSNLRSYLDDPESRVVAVNSLIGTKAGMYAKIVDESGWWDGTESKIVGCKKEEGEGCQELRLVPDMLAENSVPKTFAVLSMDFESRDVFYDRVMLGLNKGGYRPIYVVVELNPNYSKKVFEGLGYVSLGRWHYDEVFYWPGAS